MTIDIYEIDDINRGFFEISTHCKDLDGSSDGWDRTFLDISSKCTEPVCWISGLCYRMIAPLDPKKFDILSSKAAEVVLRVFVIIAAAICISTFTIPAAIITLAIAGKVTRAIGFALQKNGYTHVCGLVPEKSIVDELKVMSWNLCGIAGGLHYDHGGVIGWHARIDRIVNQIISEDSDVIVLQEIYDTALAEALVEKLKTHYAHFFMHLGANVIGSVGGVMILSKCATHHFTNTSFQNNHWTLNRTFASLEIKANPEDSTPIVKIIGTHLIHDDNPARIQQKNQIVDQIQKSSKIPTLLVGDLNLERDDPKQGGILDSEFQHSYLGSEPTRTDRLIKAWDETLDDPGSFIDYISLYRDHDPNIQFRNIHLVKAFSDDFNTKTALSDHHALAATLTGLSKLQKK